MNSTDEQTVFFSLHSNVHVDTSVHVAVSILRPIFIRQQSAERFSYLTSHKHFQRIKISARVVLTNTELCVVEVNSQS